jgi:hypothetical protein
MPFRIKDSFVIGSKTVADSAGNLHTSTGLGTDAATASAVTVTMNSATGTNNAGANLTIAGSKGNGTGIGGNIIFQTAATNTLATALTIGNDKTVTVAGGLALAGSTSGTIKFTAAATSAGAYILPAAVPAGTSVLQSDTSGNLSWVSQSGGMIYPGIGIPNSTGSAWGTSYTVSGTGTVVALATSPSFTTPTLGVASATSINKVAITAPATGSTLTIADGKTLTASNTLTFTGTDASSVAFGAGGTVAYTGGKLSQFAATTSAELLGVISDETGSGVLVFGTSPSFTTDIRTPKVTTGSAVSLVLDTNAGTSTPSITIASGADNNITLAPTGTGTVDVSSKRITSVANPSNAQDAATKAYVDATASGLDVRGSVRATTTANITLSSTQTIDGVTLVANDRVLVKNQTTGSENGIYLVSAGSWTRATDFDGSPTTEVTPGAFVFVEEGTANADSGWVLTNNGTITIGTTALTFTQFSGAGQITAGNGLTKTGNTLDVVGTANRISVAADAIDIDANYAGQNTITTLGTVGTGTWQGTLISPTYGGTGVNNGTKTITLGGNLTTSGAFATTLTVTAATTVTLPTSGTLATLGGAETFTGSKSFDQPILLSNTGTTNAAEQITVVSGNTNTSTFALDTFSGATYKTCKYIIQAVQGTLFQTTEILVVNNGSNLVDYVEYGRVFTGTEIANFTVTIASGTVSLNVTQIGATATTYKIRESFLV